MKLLATAAIALALVCISTDARPEEGRTIQSFGPLWVFDMNEGCQLLSPRPNPMSPNPHDTALWSGACIDGKASGEGRYVFRHGKGEDVFEGSMRAGARHGQGVYSFAEGHRYEGAYRDNRRNGQGVFTWPSGARYEGEWHQNWKHGQGTYTSGKGDRYEGGWSYGKAHGHGISIWADGRRYEGEWRESKPHGRGIYDSADGERFEGEWRAGCFGERDGRWAAVATTNEACGFK